MGKIGEVVFSSVDYLNSRLFAYVGRQLPLSMVELKSNVSNNVSTCAKICSLFLDSSLGLACAMGVVGVTTASVCAGEDVTEVIMEELTHHSSQMVVLCFKKHMGGEGHFEYWKPGVYNICSTPLVEVDCEKMIAQDSEHKSSVKPECMHVGHYLYERSPYYSYPNDDKEDVRHNHAMHLHSMQGFFMKALVKTTQCLGEAVFYVANQTKGKDISLYDLKQGVCSSTKIAPQNSLDPFCFSKNLNTSYLHMDPYVSADNCSAPFYTDSTSIVTEVNVCDSCNNMKLIFGVGSALTLTVTLMTKIFMQMNKPQISVSRKAKRLGTNFFHNGLLLGGSVLGSQILVQSLLDSCVPMDDETRQKVIMSIALYGASAFSRLLENTITRPLSVESTPEEKGKGALSLAV
ncbi:hypothetical protein CLAVI_000959 [Candidatus Clavichlamydia salmonicola]|uniref:hypothetical protein n=1 Tax=Candidatus Clavichlamydia salmonicola TaxID=469812 RepID=UPI001890BA67|nr:hypothetical protein [Candidatus Clavichlamydia salmonicola]MBF5051318.1 hypothetical protein [Candidatus Clavichlamydia salmonicola]